MWCSFSHAAHLGNELCKSERDAFVKDTEGVVVVVPGGHELVEVGGKQPLERVAKEDHLVGGGARGGAPLTTKDELRVGAHGTAADSGVSQVAGKGAGPFEGIDEKRGQ